MVHQLWHFLVYDCQDIQVSFEKEVAAGLIFVIPQQLQVSKYCVMETRCNNIFVKVDQWTIVNQEDK